MHKTVNSRLKILQGGGGLNRESLYLKESFASINVFCQTNRLDRHSNKKIKTIEYLLSKTGLFQLIVMSSP